MNKIPTLEGEMSSPGISLLPDDNYPQSAISEAIRIPYAAHEDFGMTLKAQ